MRDRDPVSETSSEEQRSDPAGRSVRHQRHFHAAHLAAVALRFWTDQLHRRHARRRDLELLGLHVYRIPLKFFNSQNYYEFFPIEFHYSYFFI